MDATSSAPVELPAISIDPAPSTPGSPSKNKDGAQSGKAADPRANLHTLGRKGGQPAYINHWNQYQDVGGSRESG
jgi:hypothetical protein